MRALILATLTGGGSIVSEGRTSGWRVGEWKITGVKQCRMCDVVKPISEFYRSKTTGYLDPRCKRCATIRRAEHRKTHYEDYVRYRRTRNLKRFGLSHADYDRMMVAQGGKCSVCQAEYSWGGRRFSVDHCHDTGNVRGLLCSHCNTGIGHFKESLQNLQRAMEYLRSHGVTWIPK